MYVNISVKIVIFISLFTKMSAKEYPETLSEFGYGFNNEGKLKKLDADGKPGEEAFNFNISSSHATNQKHYEALGETITDEVYRLLAEKGMHRIYIPHDIPKQDATFVFSTQKELKNPKKLLILINGSGVVRAGQWSRSLIINHSLAHGTQIPYIERARKLGYEVLTLNTNDNSRNGKPIPGNSSPTEHAANVWTNIVQKSNPESIAIVAHSYGGAVTVDLANKFKNDFAEKVFAVGFTDSVHSYLGTGVADILAKNTRNWVTSSLPLNTEIKVGRLSIPNYSAGHEKHEWTSYSCIEPLFEFLNKRYDEYEETRSSAGKKPKLDL